MADESNKYSGVCPECNTLIYARVEFLSIRPPLMVVHCPACDATFMTE